MLSKKNGQQHYLDETMSQILKTNCNLLYTMLIDTKHVFILYLHTPY